MRTHRMQLAVAGWVALAAWLGLATAARKQQRPPVKGAIVAVAEVNGGHADAAAIRSRLAQVLGVPVISVFDRGSIAARGTLTIVVDYQRRQARAQYRTQASTLTWTTAAIPKHPDPKGLWVVGHAVAVVHAAEAYHPRMRFGCLEVLDPWSNDGTAHADATTYTLSSVVLDPFYDLGPRSPYAATYTLPSEVLDPFYDLGPRSPYAATYELPTEVIDPWAPRASTRRPARTSR